MKQILIIVAVFFIDASCNLLPTPPSDLKSSQPSELHKKVSALRDACQRNRDLTLQFLTSLSFESNQPDYLKPVEKALGQMPARHTSGQETEPEVERTMKPYIEGHKELIKQVAILRNRLKADAAMMARPQTVNFIRESEANEKRFESALTDYADELD